MKIRMIKKATVFLMAAAMVLATATGAFAVAYYDAGVQGPPWTGQSSLALINNAGTRYLYFNAIAVTGPTGDSLVSSNQNIAAWYSLGSLVSGAGSTGIYNLSLVSGYTTDLNVKFGPTTYLTAQAQALQIDLGNNLIKWSDVTMGTINNPGSASQSLTDMLAIQAAGGTFKFSTFNFEHIAAVDTWLTTSGTNTDTKYFSRLEGFSAVPEPAEWMFMFIGLGMLGFYLQRRGYLNFDFSPQAAA